MTNKSTAVEKHYDSVKQHTLEERRLLENYPLVSANNRLKDAIVKRYVRKNDRVLDLACGKGGDAGRLLDRAPSYYVGVDLSSGCIEKARGRGYGDKAQFVVGNMTDPKLYAEHELLRGRTFNVINTQFSLHYVWPHMRELCGILRNLVPEGGLWIGTIVDSDKLREFKNNDTAQVTWLPPEAIGEKKWDKYLFNLPPAVLNCEEYVVPWREFLQVMREAGGFELLDSRLFQQEPHGARLSPPQRAVHNLYRYFVMVRQTAPAPRPRVNKETRSS